MTERAATPKTRVVHVRDKVAGAVYIGRAMPRQGLKASPFCNPYKISPQHTREEVIEQYRAYLLSRPDLLGRLPEIRGKSLSCWCRSIQPGTPQMACHGDVLIALLEQLYPEQKESK